MKIQTSCVKYRRPHLLCGYVSRIFLAILFGAGSIQFQCAPHPADQNVMPARKVDLLREQIANLTGDPNLFNTQIGLYLEALSNGEVIYRQNEHKLFIPASNMKIFTTATALLKFGPHFRFHTSVYTDGKIKKDILQGNLIIRGKGDPALAPRFYNGDVRQVFQNWADSLLALGIREINGDLIGDESYFQTDRLGSGWQWDDEPYWYAAPISALVLNDNCVDVTVAPNDTIGLRPRISLMPPSRYFTVENRASTALADSVQTLILTRPRLQNIIIAENEIPQNKPPYQESISVENPALFFVTVFSEVLESKGITLHGSLHTNRELNQIPYDSCRMLLTHLSPELAEIIEITNKVSQNLYAEQLLLALAAEYGRQATAAAGTQIVLQQMKEIGIAEMEFVMVDGSGLSRNNLITPNAVGTLLRFMARHPYFEYFYNSLPVTGVDGTLKNRMKETPAESKVHAKTGFVGHVRNLSGYIYSADNEVFLFSMLVNNYTVPTPLINNWQDEICILLCNFQR